MGGSAEEVRSDSLMAERVGIVVYASPDRDPAPDNRRYRALPRRYHLYRYSPSPPPETRLYIEIDFPSGIESFVTDVTALPVVHSVSVRRTMGQIYGKRIIIMGGGARVGQVAIGAITEADRHNIRGEHISIDTIPLVGEQALAEAVRAVVNLPRVKALVLAGHLWAARLWTPFAKWWSRATGCQPQYGRGCSRCRGPGGDGPGASGRDGRHGSGTYGQVRCATAEPTSLLVRHRRARRLPPTR